MQHRDRHRLFRWHDDRSTPPLAWRRRLLAWLSLFALLFNVAGATALPAAASTVDAALHVLCTAGGMVAQPQQDGGPVSDDGSGGVSCAFCLPLLHAGTVPVATAQSPEPLQAGQTSAVVSAPAASQKLRRQIEPASPRAPPR